jgi:ADP-heptose:LPS heptosyltransferase
MTKNILIFRTDRVGDLIVSCPTILTIKETFKNPNITLVASTKNYDYAKNLSFFDNILIFPSSNILAKIKFIFKLRKKTFDYIYIFDGKEKSFISAFLIKSSIKVGISTKIKKYQKFLNIKIFLFANHKLYDVFQKTLDYTKINKQISFYNFISKKKKQ